jgi:hypothetical protein
MEIYRIFSSMGIAALVDIVVSLLPMLAGALYMFKPTEHRLAMMRPVSLAGMFAGLSGTALGAINTLRGLWLEPPRDGRIAAIASAESIVPLFVAFSCLMIAWLCVAVGMRRTTDY